ncbi:MAG: DUF2334 domain-containing protein [Kyrpidia sp.]|nr:DUF2334 domain-containing protein [Kyrpidia sp.]
MRQCHTQGIRIAVILLLFIFIPVQTAMSVYQGLWPDHRHVALLRLEDVSAGPPYHSPDDLGRLRAVLEFLRAERVPYQITVVPRYVGADDSGRPTIYDITSPDASAFVHLLRWACANGAVVGMHGYTHQFGQPDWRHPETITTIGREFDVPGQPETRSPEYAAGRMADSVRSFAAAGLAPGFWETPHYAATVQQEQAFQDQFGLLYEPDRTHLRSLKDVVPLDGAAGRGTRGAVYVPTPLGYVRSDQPETSVRRILTKASVFDGLGSLYYHPVLEFSFLEPVTEAGRPVWRDGLPEYRYRPDRESYLHQLVYGLQREGYVFESLHQVVPLQPAWRYDLPGDVLTVGRPRGRRNEDWITADPGTGKIWVTPSDRDWLRTSPAASPALWRQVPADIRVQGLAAVDIDGDGRDDLVIAARGRIYVCRSLGTSFGPAQPLALSFSPGDRVVSSRFLGGRPSLAVIHASGTVELYALGPGITEVSPAIRLTGAETAGRSTPPEWFAWDLGTTGTPLTVPELGQYDPVSGDLLLYRWNGREILQSSRAALPPGLRVIPIPGSEVNRQVPVLVGYMPSDGRWIGWRLQGETLTDVGPAFGPWMAEETGPAVAGLLGPGLPCVAVASGGGGKLTVETAITYFGWAPFAGR